MPLHSLPAASAGQKWKFVRTNVPWQKAFPVYDGHYGKDNGSRAGALLPFCFPQFLVQRRRYDDMHLGVHDSAIPFSRIPREPLCLHGGAFPHAADALIGCRIICTGKPAFGAHISPPHGTRGRSLMSSWQRIPRGTREPSPKHQTCHGEKRQNNATRAPSLTLPVP
jgi:hypothetical protein